MVCTQVLCDVAPNWHHTEIVLEVLYLWSNCNEFWCLICSLFVMSCLFWGEFFLSSYSIQHCWHAEAPLADLLFIRNCNSAALGIIRLCHLASDFGASAEWRANNFPSEKKRSIPSMQNQWGDHPITKKVSLCQAGDQGTEKVREFLGKELRRFPSKELRESYRDRLKSWYVVWWNLFLLAKQGQEQISPNHVPRL